ncbi:T9SS type A sorting domain-containing protein [Flavobacterium sp. AG291]|uniref:T9SS type A sorting domain-containing protein n=1 Tax=Flavobacterium sp. AG291 TaxID=2184000 RepID=UPI000E0B4D9B|nr:T9SS type A sorting domain-containing protein [Flavobacterium sp. AG291]
MMKKLLLFCAVFLAGTAMMFAQFPSIGILGSSTPAGWESDLDMTTTDGVVYTYENLVIVVPSSDPGVKFRQDDAWTTNWGGTGFPSGTASLNGANIPAVNGTYNVTFNLSTLAYSFVPVGVEIPEVMLNGEGVAVNLSSTDGVHYSARNVSIPETTVDFSIDDTGMGWGSSSFPSGTAVEGGMIPVAGNMYNITFNLETKAYSFDYVVISMIGLGIVTEDPGWVTDTDMSTTDGKNYTLSNFNFPGGEGKFRLDHSWDTTAWGSTDFPSGTATSEPGGPNLNITAGIWDVAFNRETGAYSFTAPVAGVNEFGLNGVSVYPNPTQNQWNFAAEGMMIDQLSIVDVTGKTVFANQVKASVATINAEGFAPGMYFAKLTSGNAVKTVKIIRK